MEDQNSEEYSIDNSMGITKEQIIFIGNTCSGKTAIINRIMGDPFVETGIQVGIDYLIKKIRFRDKEIKLQIWDSVGQEKYRGFIPLYLRKSSIIFIVYDTNDKHSFEQVPTWLSLARSTVETTIVLLGSKTDLNKREVEKSEGEELAKREGLLFFECSAKTNDNIKNLFYSSIVWLPIFEEYELNGKENLIKELIFENEDGVKIEGDATNDTQIEKQDLDKINFKGELISVKKKKKRCGC